MKEKRFVMSTEDLNSYGFWVSSAGIDLTDFAQNPVGFYNHDSSALPALKWKDLAIENGKLMGTAVFDENDTEAMKLWSKVENGFLNAASIGISILEWSEEKELLKQGQTNSTVTKCRLRECSIVNVPANKKALAVRLYDQTEAGYITLSDTNLSAYVPTITQTNMFDKLTTLGYKDAEAVLSEIDTLKKELATLLATQKEANKAQVRALCEKKGLTAQETADFQELAEANFPKTVAVLSARPDYVSVTDLIAGKTQQNAQSQGALAQLHAHPERNFNDWASEKNGAKFLQELEEKHPEKFEALYQKTFAK